MSESHATLNRLAEWMLESKIRASTSTLPYSTGRTTCSIEPLTPDTCCMAQHHKMYGAQGVGIPWQRIAQALNEPALCGA